MIKPITALFLLPVAAMAVQYGVDCSFPIHSDSVSNCPQKDIFADDRQASYERFMQGCRDYYGKKGHLCDEYETDRIRMSRLQPQSMVNYTDTGFKKIRAPDAVMQLLYQHWEANKEGKTQEVWSTGNIYVNSWEAPTYMVSVENSALDGAGFHLKQAVWDAVQPTIEAWTGMEQKPISQYGIRIYTEGSVLSPHVDRLPLVSSCIINVAQDVDEPWPLTVIDRQGNEVNVTMLPGDMVLYESGSLIHARPFPLKGRYMANIFIHFEPTGRPLDDMDNSYLDTLPEMLPPYLLPGSPWVSDWLESNPNGWKKPAPSEPKLTSKSITTHHAAAIGDLETLRVLAQKDRKLLDAQDENGWQPIHEATRSGQLDALRMLLEHGVDKDAVARGVGTALFLAREYLSEDHDVIQHLKNIGALDATADEL